VAQVLAILPGISRSGITIVGGLSRRFDEEWAPRFAFLLSAPAILGATAIKAKDLFHTLHAANAGATPWATYVLACAVSAAVGYVAIALVIRAVRGSKLKYFAVWCVLMGIMAIVWGSRG
jgi:undecaprenyl-diphosphatase